jgi:hypothetical protein
MRRFKLNFTNQYSVAVRSRNQIPKTSLETKRKYREQISQFHLLQLPAALSPHCQSSRQSSIHPLLCRHSVAGFVGTRIRSQKLQLPFYNKPHTDDQTGIRCTAPTAPAVGQWRANHCPRRCSDVENPAFY